MRKSAESDLAAFAAAVAGPLARWQVEVLDLVQECERLVARVRLCRPDLDAQTLRAKAWAYQSASRSRGVLAFLEDFARRAIAAEPMPWETSAPYYD